MTPKDFECLIGTCKTAEKGRGKGLSEMNLVIWIQWSDIPKNMNYKVRVKYK